MPLISAGRSTRGTCGLFLLDDNEAVLNSAFFPSLEWHELATLPTYLFVILEVLVICFTHEILQIRKLNFSRSRGMTSFRCDYLS